MILKKFDIIGVDPATFLVVGETSHKTQIELSIHKQGKVTGIVRLACGAWFELMDLRYNLKIFDKEDGKDAKC